MSEEPKYFRPPGYDYSRESIKNRPSDAQPPADSPYIPEISEEITDAQAAALEARVFQDLPAPEAPKEGKLEKLRSKVANSKLVKWLGLAEIDEQEEPSSTAEFSEPKAPTGQDGPSWVEKASRILGLDAPAKQYEDALNSPDDEFSFLPTPPSIPISNSVTQETTIKNQEQETSSLNLKEKSSQLFSIPNHFLEGGPDVLEGMEYVGYNKTVEDTSKSALVNTSAPAVVDQKILIDEATKRLRQTISSRGEKLGLVNRGKNETQPSKINYQKSLLNKSRPAPQIRGQVTEREKKSCNRKCKYN